MFEKNKSVVTVMAALLVALVWSLFNIQGHMSAAIGWKGTHFHIIHGLDVVVWAILFCAFRCISFNECIGIGMIGAAIMVAPDTIVSLMDDRRFYDPRAYNEMLTYMVFLTVGAAFALAWLNDYLSELDRRHEAKVTLE